MPTRIQIIIFDLLMAVALLFYVDLHETAHMRNCEYNGFNATRLSFTLVKCDSSEIDNAPDVYNEIVASIFIPSILIIMAYVSLIKL